MPYREITLTVPPEAFDAVAHFLTTHVGGIAVDDEAMARLRVYLPIEEGLASRLAALRAELRRLAAYFPGMDAVGWTEGTVNESDWAQAWRAHFRPVRLGRRLVVSPTWEEPRTFPGELLLRLDPGMAFGTGAHASTALCLRAAEVLAARGGHALDVGTGSGILAVAQALLGAARVTAVDVDPVAVRVAKDNVGANAVEDRVEVRYATLADALAGGCPPAAWALANLTADVLEAIAPDLWRGLLPGGLVVASGIVDAGRERVARAFAATGLRLVRTERLQGWTALWAVRPAGAVARA